MPTNHNLLNGGGVKRLAAGFGQCWPRLVLSFLAAHTGVRLMAAEVDVAKLPPPAGVTVDYDRDVRPIFEQSCFRCHGPNKAKSRFRLDNRESALKGGDDNTNDIVPGDSARSRLIHYVAGLDPDTQMPPGDRDKPLTVAQIRLLRAWIDQGAHWSTNAPSKLSLSITPTLRWISVHGNRSQFREIEGINDGWAGGLEHFELHEQVSPDTAASVEGRALAGDENYRLALRLVKNDVGFVHAGFESWREFYNDTGGFAPTLPTNAFALHRDLHLDVGRAWFEAGLTLPHYPRLVLGYEYQFREGDKSTLQWGPAGTLPPFDPNTDAKSVYPAFEHLDEHAHLLKLDASHELRGWELADHAVVEFYDLSTRRQNAAADTFGPGPDTLVVVRETYHHVSGANTFRVNKQLADWLSVSGGYLYARLEGDGTLDQSTLAGNGQFTGGLQWQADRLMMMRETHATSVAGLAGPWAGLSLSMGGQGEWVRQKTVGQEDLRIGDPSIPILFSDPSAVTGDLDTASARENVLLRYTAIPFTILSGELRLRQESLARFDERPDGSEAFALDTDADIQTSEYRTGFNTSPWSSVSFGADYRRRDRRTDYTHVEPFNPSGHLYPGFILWRDIVDNQVDARVTWRANAWLRTAFTFKWVQSDFNSATGPVPGSSPGGALDAANFESRVYSLNAVLTPFRRLFFSGTFSFSDSLTRTASNGAGYLAPWQGNVYSVLTSATFALSPATDLRESYAFTQSDYGQNNAASGLPAGIVYDRHAVQVSLVHRFKDGVATTLGYGFFQYHEPSFGGLNDYRAHALFASATIPVP